MNRSQTRLPYVLFLLKDGLYAVASQAVREIVPIPMITPVPETPAEVRGVINLRGKVIPLMDLRVRLGLPPLRAEINALIQLLHDREQDHRNWLGELEACVRERRAFGLARDPRQCKFGKWYDQYKAQDRLLRMTLPSMDAPHRAIHATADRALALAEAGSTQAALDLITARRHQELAALIKLFEESRRTLADDHREVAIVLACEQRPLAFSADLVVAAEDIPEMNTEPLPPVLAGPSRRPVMQIGKRLKTHETILILEDAFFKTSIGLN